MVKEACIHIQQADFGYVGKNGPVKLLQNFSASFYPGERIGLVGLNGVGKSTFIRTLAGLQPLLSGSITIGKQTLSESSALDLAKQMALVLTERPAGFNLTVFDVVASGQMPYTNAFHRLEAEHLDVIRKAISLIGIEPFQHKELAELSDGMFQKTLIAKALAQQTPILLLDEPSAFLDYGSKHELFLLLKQLSLEQQKCILVSSHDLDLLIKYCDKLLVLTHHSAELIPVSEAMHHEGFKAIGGKFLH